MDGEPVSPEHNEPCACVPAHGVLCLIHYGRLGPALGYRYRLEHGVATTADDIRQGLTWSRPAGRSSHAAHR